MQQVVYKCDNCKNEIGEKRHFSLSFGKHSGVAVPPRMEGNKNSEFWHVTKTITGKFIHLCGIRCLNEYFKALMKK